ncbi:hypothetical protein BMS3Abin03_00159 [bacterium BMS3Abin03]|nr:hypothetical protein BMS3Abin03_00159 [bacterium BMS3Abin03]
MKHRKTIIEAVIILITLSAISFAQETVKKSFPLSEGGNLKVAINFGNIIYTPGSGSRVEVEGKNIIQEELGLFTVQKQGNTIKVEFRGEDSDDFELEISGLSKINLDFSTGGGNIKLKGDVSGKVEILTGGGNISTDNIYGTIDISTAGGNIKLGNIKGKADVSTAGGDMKLGNIDGEADINTAGGNIKVGNITHTAQISTAGGNISVENVGGDAEVSTAGGNIKVNYVSGSAKINTAGGNIKLSGASGKVETNSGAGNLKLKNIKGPIEANTGAGNIYAELYPDGKSKSEFNSGVGNITLLIPSSANATIIAKTNVLMWGNDENKMDQIESDFEPLSINKNKNKMQIEAEYKLNNGGSVIELNVHMGKIKIRKME